MQIKQSVIKRRIKLLLRVAFLLSPPRNKLRDLKSCESPFFIRTKPRSHQVYFIKARGDTEIYLSIFSFRVAIKSLPFISPKAQR